MEFSNRNSQQKGGHRFSVDFQALNNITKPLAYPLPLIDDILVLLGKSTYFSTLDLRSGYWQVALDEADREKTTFACHVGLYQSRVMPFGLANAPGIFKQLMSVVLGGLEQFAMAYLDDILIFSASINEHLRHLKIVFVQLRKHGLKIKLPKCKFMKKKTKYLGFVIDKSGVHPDIDKVEVIRALPKPQTVREVTGFRGAIGYYRRFIPAFWRIATPLIALTKKYARFSWTEDCQRSFNTLKEQLTADDSVHQCQRSVLALLSHAPRGTAICQVCQRKHPFTSCPINCLLLSRDGPWLKRRLMP